MDLKWVKECDGDTLRATREILFTSKQPSFLQQKTITIQTIAIKKKKKEKHLSRN